jgi:hypothetical protein
VQLREAWPTLLEESCSHDGKVTGRPVADVVSPLFSMVV